MAGAVEGAKGMLGTAASFSWKFCAVSGILIGISFLDGGSTALAAAAKSGSTLGGSEFLSANLEGLQEGTTFLSESAQSVATFLGGGEQVVANATNAVGAGVGTGAGAPPPATSLPGAVTNTIDLG